jgi:hypothetical protein
MSRSAVLPQPWLRVKAPRLVQTALPPVLLRFLLRTMLLHQDRSGLVPVHGLARMPGNMLSAVL